MTLFIIQVKQSFFQKQKFKNETQNGLGMFIYQAQESFEIWHGFPSEVDEKIYTMLHK